MPPDPMSLDPQLVDLLFQLDSESQRRGYGPMAGDLLRTLVEYLSKPGALQAIQRSGMTPAHFFEQALAAQQARGAGPQQGVQPPQGQAMAFPGGPGGPLTPGVMPPGSPQPGVRG